MFLLIRASTAMRRAEKAQAEKELAARALAAMSWGLAVSEAPLWEAAALLREAEARAEVERRGR